MALQHLLLLVDPRPAVIFTNSHSALVQLSSLDRATPFVRQIADICRAVEDAGWSLTLQWNPSHSRIAGNDKADALAAAAHDDPLPMPFLNSFTEGKSLIQTRITSKHPDSYVAAGRPLPPVPSVKTSRGARALLHRLRAGCAFTNVQLHRFGRTQDQTCSSCGAMESAQHAVWSCPALASYRAELLNTLRKTGHVCASYTELIFPTGSPALVHQWFELVLNCLHETELDRRL